MVLGLIYYLYTQDHEILLWFEATERLRFFYGPMQKSISLIPMRGRTMVDVWNGLEGSALVFIGVGS